MSLITKGLKSILTFSSGRGQNQKLIILIYHRVLNEPDFMYPYTVDKEKFNWQMALLASEFNVLSLSDALNLLDSGLLPPRAVCITFDDGYADNYFNALPILKKYNLPATFFIVSGMLNQDRMWSDDILEAVRLYSMDNLDLRDMGLDIYPVTTATDKMKAADKIIHAVKYFPAKQRNSFCESMAQLANNLPKQLMLSTDQLHQLHQAGMEIGGHSVNHPILKNLSIDSWQYEIQANKVQLEQVLNAPVRYFAYPNGKSGQDYSEQQVRFIQSCGYEAAFSTDWGYATRTSARYELPRFTPWDHTPTKFMLRMIEMYSGYM